MIHPSIVNIEAERVPFVDQDDRDELDATSERINGLMTKGRIKVQNSIYITFTNSTIGRFPSQLFVDDMAAKSLNGSKILHRISYTSQEEKELTSKFRMYKNNIEI